MTFERFPGRFTLEGRLRAVTALRVGAGRALAPVGTDLPVVRDALGAPFIPGSSLKGPLRATVERLVRGVRPDRVCNPLDDRERCVSASDMQRLREESQRRTDAESADAWLTSALLEQTCWVCRLFGSPWLASAVQVADLPVDRASWFGQFQVRDGVAIDRDTETVRGGLKYDYEVVPAGTEFLFRLRADTDDPRLLGMLALGLRELETERLAVGGGRSRGLGRVELVVERRRLVRRDSDSLLRYLAEPETAGEAIDEVTVRDWVGAFLACLRDDAMPVEAV
ncbi:MAG TPA: CRISPR-associated RAMP protein Csx7 [Chloroflexota bacterium]|nr:CRISPR-associated RAMP protein Csx7 [Chloroflexota bacterium]